MGTKHNKKRYLVVKYKAKPDKKFDELVEMSKKKIGAGKMAEAAIVLDLQNQKVFCLPYFCQHSPSTPIFLFSYS